MARDLLSLACTTISHVYRAKFMYRTALLAIALLASLSNCLHAAPMYAAGNWNNDQIHLLDGNLQSISSFPLLASNPNGVAFSNGLIYSGHFTNNTITAYDLTGASQFTLTNPQWGNLQGLEFVNGELAVASVSGAIGFYSPVTGAFIRSIPNIGGTTVEGLAYDGNLLWLLGDDLLGVNPATGVLVSTLPNPAGAESFDGTSLAVGGIGQLIIGASSGNFYRVSTLNGSVLETGNNGVSMFGLTAISQQVEVPEPASLALWSILGTAGIAAWRRKRKATAA